MATYASRPAWELGATGAGSARVVVPLGLGLLLAVSLLLRTRELDVGFWIDEGLSVGIADRPLTDIPGRAELGRLAAALLHAAARLDVGRGRRGAEPTRSRCVRRLTVPVAWWAARGLFGRARADRGAARGAQPVPDALRAGGAHVRARRAAGADRDDLLAARVRDGRASRRAAGGAAWAVGSRSRCSELMYTHNRALFFAVGYGRHVAGAAGSARGAERRELLQDGLWGFGGALLYAPWLPTLTFQATHTGAPRGPRPELGAPCAADGHCRIGRPGRPAARGGRRRDGAAGSAARARISAVARAVGDGGVLADAARR